jgi:hypothetical protein
MVHHITDDKVEAKFTKLLSEGREILVRAGFNGLNYYTTPPAGDYVRFRTGAMNLIHKVCGPSSSHYEAIKGFAESRESMWNGHYTNGCLAVLEAAYADFQDGFLSELKLLVRADLLDDFLSQAEALLEQGYHIAAASLAGAVLEDTLRKLCDKHSISYGAKTKIDALNSDLAKADVYDKLIQKEITAKADLRNNADHGHFDKVRAQDVADMVRWIRRFVTENLS